MKRLLSFVFCAFLFSTVAFAEPIVYEKPDVKIFVEGESLNLAQEVPIIVNSRTLVPLRKLLVGLGVPDNTENIQWIGETREVKVNYNGVKIELAIDNSKAYINGKEYTLDSAPIIHRDRTYLPARFVGEALGYTITWDAYTPAVMVTSNKNMEKLTQILNDLTTAINDVKSYEYISTKKINGEAVYDGEVDKFENTLSVLERADLAKKIVYTEEKYTDDIEQNLNFSYNTEDAFYNCYKYLEDGVLYNTGWEKLDYLPDESIETPFEEKSKVPLIKIPEELYGALTVKEYENAYVVSTVSDQVEILKAIDGSEMYYDILEYGEAENFEFQLAISKETNLPIDLQISFDLISQESSEEDGYEYSCVEKTEYLVKFSEYNQYLDIKLPTV